MGIDHFAHRISAMGTKEREKCQCTCKGGKYHTEMSTWKYTTIYCQKCGMGFHLEDCFQIFLTKVNYWD
jgi:hypothetical protein